MSATQPWSPSGLASVQQLRWGSHLIQLFKSGDELRDVLVPYFKAGLENNERCLWVTGEAFDAERARSALRLVLPDLDQRERNQQIEIVNGEEWYSATEKLRPLELVGGLIQREQEALGLGYAGLRTSGNCAWVAKDQWADFLEYEALVQDIVRSRRMICMCSYCVEKLEAPATLEAIDRHDLVIRSSSRPVSRFATASAKPLAAEVEGSREGELAKLIERQKQTFDLAMQASDMGAWRYTLADNICEYDENAQKLYGLNEARFLHDDEGTQSKFHPDDLETMWARVAKALDPTGDGRYDVEYRVKQADGSWRWLSAWGLVEFEGEYPNKEPVAIVGASRDLTQQKKAEELQRLLLNELNHRVKNTMATIQAVTAQTLKTAEDLPSARTALDRRIRSMAQAHDLLSKRAWAAANLSDIVTRSLDAFPSTQVAVSGDPIDVSPGHALSLSLALHELATNAAKYGALSRPEGRVNIRWGLSDGLLQLDWKERGGPPVSPPTRKGFGSRLLENLIRGDLAGNSRVNYNSAGFECTITAKL